MAEGHDEVEQAMQDMSVPKVYSNSFAVGQSPADFILLFQVNGENAVVLNVSFQIAESLGQALLDSVEKLEKILEHSILSIPEMNRKQLEFEREPNLPKEEKHDSSY